MADFGSALWNKPTSGDTGEGGGASDPVTRSLRLVGPASSSSSTASETCNLKRTFSSAGNRKTYTVAFWVKRSSISNSKQTLFSSGGSGDSNTNEIAFRSNDTLEFYLYPSTSMSRLATAAKFRDVNAWYHITVAVDTTQATAANRVKMFVNGVQQTFETHTTYPDQNDQSHFNDSKQHKFGEEQHRNRYNAEVLLADCYFIDGSAIEPVGNFIESTGYSSYKPKAFDMSSYSGNSFHIDAQPAHDADLLVSSIDRNDGDTLFADCTGHTITRYGNTHHDNTVGNPFGSGTAMYFDGSGDYLQTSTSSDLTFGTGDFTVETWFYPTTVDTSAGYKGIISDELYSSTGGWAVSQRDDELSLWIKNTGGSWVSFVADGALTANQWQHIAVSYDSSTTTTRLFVDGTSVVSGTTSGWNLTGDQIEIGRSISGQEITGYLFDARATKGTARYTSNFTAPTAAFELNPVYIGGDQSGNKNHFTPTGISAAHDVMLDTPTKNYAVLNPLDKPVYSTRTPAVLTEGNVKAVLDDLTGITGTIGINQSSATSSKWYVEFYYISQSGAGGDDRACFGFEGTNHAISNSNRGYNINLGTGSGWEFVCLFSMNGAFQNMSNNPTGSNLGSNVTVGDIVGVAFDLENNKFYAHKNGNWGDGSGWNQSSFSNASGMDIPSGKTWVPAIYNQGGATATVAFNGGSDPTFGGNKTSGQDTSQSEFYYAPPTGFKSLNTSNLDDPSVTPSEHFDILTYTGNSDLYNGSGSTQNVTGVNFDVGMAWIKDRDNSSSGYTSSGSDEHGHYLFDTVTGTSSGGYNLDGDVVSSGSGPYLNSGYYGVTSFSAGSGTNRGITVDEAGETNFDYDDGSYQLTERYVAWLWKLGSTGDSSSWNGSYTAPSTEHYNAAAGVTTIEVSPVSSGNLEVAHSLSAAPEFFFVSTDSYGDFSGYPAFHKDLSSGNYLQLDGTSAQSSDSTYFPSGAAHADYIKLGSVFADSYSYGNNLRIWAFTEVKGFSKFGKYTGGSDPFIYTGFEVGFWMVKRIDSNGHWTMFDSARDTHNLVDHQLEPNYSFAESTNSTKGGDFLSNGFKVRSSQNEVDATGGTYVYAAFSSSSPFKYANAR